MKEKIEHRFISLYEIFEALGEMMEWEDKVYLNKGLLRLTVKSYFDDIVRYRDYHKSKRADQHKKAAFTIKWIAKIRPVQLRIDGKELARSEMLCNQLFAVIAGLSFLDIDITDISNKFFDHLLYTTQFRDIDSLQLSTSMYLLEKSMNKERA